MAHIEKYKAGAVGRMLDHYTRSRDAVLSRDNIDETRTHLNYAVEIYEKDGQMKVGRTEGKACWADVKGRMDGVEASTGKKVRKDAVVMADVVITAPGNVPKQDLEKFFAYAYEYVARRVGIDNMLGGYVHMDETTPHMHAAFTPIKDGKFSYKSLCPRSFYQTFHRGLGKHLESRMGYLPDVELPPEKAAEKALSSVPQDKLDESRAALLSKLEIELGELRAEVEAEKQRLEGVRHDIDEVGKRISRVEHAVGRARSAIANAVTRLRALVDRGNAAGKELMSRAASNESKKPKVQKAPSQLRRVESPEQSMKRVAKAANRSGGVRGRRPIR